MICLWIFCSGQGDLCLSFFLNFSLWHTPLTVNFKPIRLFLIGNINFILCVLWFVAEAEDEHHASLAGACQWSGEHDEHDDEILRVVKCRWRKCGAVLQSRTHCLKHVQVMHVGELVVDSFVLRKRSVMANFIHLHSIQEDAPDGWEKFCRWEGCAVDSFVTPNMLLDHVAWHIRGKWLCRFDSTSTTCFCRSLYNPLICRVPQNI